jgi:catechol 2,3-dioxygenase
MNVWESRGAGVRAPALGLAEIRIDLPTADALGATVERMRSAGVQTRDDGRLVGFDDPWGNRIELAVTA